MNAEWIDASSKKPLPFERVLGFRSGYAPYICYVNKDGEWFTGDHVDLHHLTHWMPLPPEPPKRESSFEKWWYQLNPSPTYGMDVRQVKGDFEIRKPFAKVIWDAAIAASKQPDFVE